MRQVQSVRLVNVLRMMRGAPFTAVHAGVEVRIVPNYSFAELRITAEMFAARFGLAGKYRSG